MIIRSHVCHCLGYSDPLQGLPKGRHDLWVSSGSPLCFMAQNYSKVAHVDQPLVGSRKWQVTAAFQKLWERLLGSLLMTLEATNCGAEPLGAPSVTTRHHKEITRGTPKKNSAMRHSPQNRSWKCPGNCFETGFTMVLPWFTMVCRSKIWPVYASIDPVYNWSLSEFPGVASADSSAAAPVDSASAAAAPHSGSAADSGRRGRGSWRARRGRRPGPTRWCPIVS